MIIRPTHTCFDDSLEMLEQAVRANEGAFESDELHLVHAICRAPNGDEFAHAWIETHGTHVWFTAIVEGKRTQFRADIKEYYAEFNVKETTKYTPPEAWAMNCKFETYGPWIDRYIALCGRDRKVWFNEIAS